MTIRLNLVSISRLYLGSTQINKAMLGGEVVFTSQQSNLFEGAFDGLFASAAALDPLFTIDGVE
jgi:hypothetical protein